MKAYKLVIDNKNPVVVYEVLDIDDHRESEEAKRVCALVSTALLGGIIDVIEIYFDASDVKIIHEINNF